VKRKRHYPPLAWRDLGWLVVAIVATSCVPPAPVTPPAPPPTPALTEEQIQPTERLDVQIIDFHETPSPDHKTDTVTGTLVNRGTRATREVRVHVEALDKNGAAVSSTNPAPSTQVIAPGATATFSATFEGRADVDRYHAEAISR
jgi:hypothetical protein